MTMNKQHCEHVEQAQIDEAKRALRENGYQENDFSIRESLSKQQHAPHFSQQDEQRQQHVSRMEKAPNQPQQQYEICVKCEKTGKEQTYKSKDWINQFKDDLKHHKFK